MPLVVLKKKKASLCTSSRFPFPPSPTPRSHPATSSRSRSSGSSHRAAGQQKQEMPPPAMATPQAPSPPTPPPWSSPRPYPSRRRRAARCRPPPPPPLGWPARSRAPIREKVRAFCPPAAAPIPGQSPRIFGRAAQIRPRQIRPCQLPLCLDRKNVADKQVRWTDIGEKKQELVPNIEKDHAKQVRMAENSSRIQELVPNVKKDRSSHRRSIAELRRRTEISKRVRNLQELVPNMEKIIKQTIGTPKPYTDMDLPGINPLPTNMSDMLDLAVDYIKELQMQIKTTDLVMALSLVDSLKVMKEEEVICTCLPSKQNHSPADEAQQPTQSKPTLDEASAILVRLWALQGILKESHSLFAMFHGPIRTLLDTQPSAEFARAEY
uniref:Predicted protein n=1 Tax=Hordeum vulgare subsp. vulgare TaxID=112509 RepID=F2CVX2_HORVV|nr:predicted protein [Hordeum vulgare subsp. vulgare]